MLIVDIRSADKWNELFDSSDSQVEGRERKERKKEGYGVGRKSGGGGIETEIVGERDAENEHRLWLGLQSTFPPWRKTSATGNTANRRDEIARKEKGKW